ncbi:MAG: peptidoglycan editing factor PgeF [Prevotella sp.]
MEPVLTYFNLSTAATVFSTTRHGGASKGLYGELNINPFCGDDKVAVLRNRQALAHVLTIEEQHLVLPHQVHGTAIKVVDDDFFALTSEARGRFVEGIDGIMTDCKGVSIGVSTADCIPIILYDEAHHAAAAVHAGWRGTVKRIAGKAVNAMTLRYGTRPEQLKALIGPGISLKNFEVGDEVFDAFRHEGFDMNRIAVRYEKWHIDLPECNRLQLIETGVRAENIINSAICTYDNAADYFSARHLGINSGRIYTGIIVH